MNTKSLALTGLLLSLAVAGAAHASSDHRAPAVPPGLQVPAGHKVSFHAYAEGVQIYVGMPSAADPTRLEWVFAAPEAILYDPDGEVVGSHYAFAGPTRPAWESASGSRVVGSRLAPPVTVEPNAIPWLLLEAVQAQGPGIFRRTTFIQRVNTTGGLMPAQPPTHAGQEARVPYTAEYFFYRVSDGPGGGRSLH